MTDYITEQEQIELLKSWIKQYAPMILAGVLIAALIVSGWQLWEKHQQKKLAHASLVFDELIAAQFQHNNSNIITQAQKILKHYSNTVYANMAALTLANVAVEQKNLNEAKNQLNWVMTHTSTPAFKQIARIRLARILIAENKGQEALTTLATIDDKSFEPLIAEIRGDAYLSMNNKAEALKAYRTAINSYPSDQPVRPVLQMKHDSLMKA